MKRQIDGWDVPKKTRIQKAGHWLKRHWLEMLLTVFTVALTLYLIFS